MGGGGGLGRRGGVFLVVQPSALPVRPDVMVAFTFSSVLARHGTTLCDRARQWTV